MYIPLTTVLHYKAHLNYCSSMWGQTSQENLTAIKVLNQADP